MSKQHARADRRRSYQIVLVAALEWAALAPGQCARCGRHDRCDTGARRTRYTTYDSGLLDTYALQRPGEDADAFADRFHAQMNRRQREGDFTTLGPPQSLCAACATAAAQDLVAVERDAASRRQMFSMLRSLATVAPVLGERPWTAVMLIAEPGADGRWRLNVPCGVSEYNADQVYQMARRAIDSGQSLMSAFGTPGGFEWQPLPPERP